MIGTIASFRAYATARGNPAPTAATDVLATAALVRASDYITYSYVQQFLSGYDATSPNVEEATYEAAILELATPNFFSSTFTMDQRKVLTEVKGIKWTVVAGPSGISSSQAATPMSTKIAAMLEPYMPGLFVVGFRVLGG